MLDYIAFLDGGEGNVEHEIISFCSNLVYVVIVYENLILPYGIVVLYAEVQFMYN